MRLSQVSGLSTPAKLVLLCRSTTTELLPSVSVASAQKVSEQKKSTSSQSFLLFCKGAVSAWAKRLSSPTQSAGSDSTRFKLDQSPASVSGSIRPDSFGLEATLKLALAPSPPTVTVFAYRPGLCATQSVAHAMRLPWASTNRLCGTCHWRHWCSGPWPVPAPKCTTASGTNKARASPNTARASSVLVSAGKEVLGNIAIFSVLGQVQPERWSQCSVLAELAFWRLRAL